MTKLIALIFLSLSSLSANAQMTQQQWECQQMMDEYRSLKSQEHYQNSDRAFADCMAQQGPGRGAVCAAQQSGQSFGRAIGGALGGSSRLQQLEVAIRANCLIR